MIASIAGRDVRRTGWDGAEAACFWVPHVGQKFALSPIGEPH
nr:hypothetical protein [Phytoactinopolyspora halotolerans]